MIATLLVALFATVALASAVSIADAAVRSRNAFRLLRGDLVRIDAVRQVIVSFEDAAAPRMPALRPALKSSRQGPVRRPARAAEPLRVAA